MSRTNRKPNLRVEQLDPARVDQVIDVLRDAFHNYPVMRYVIGDTDHYDERLRTLVHFFVMARALRDEPILGTSDGPVISGAALVTPPGPREMPEALAEIRENVWRELGEQARQRYEYLGELWKDFAVDAPNLHLGMIGVRASHKGRGIGRILLDDVHDRSRRDPVSTGVTLTTEDPSNVPLYEHFGYALVGKRNVDGKFDTWGFFRRDAS